MWEVVGLMCSIASALQIGVNRGINSFLTHVSMIHKRVIVCIWIVVVIMVAKELHMRFIGAIVSQM